MPKNINIQDFEILDDINLVCDSYEKDENIRKADKHCIDETQLRHKILTNIKRIK